VLGIAAPEVGRGERKLRTALIAIYPTSPSLELDREMQRGSNESRPFLERQRAITGIAAERTRLGRAIFWLTAGRACSVHYRRPRSDINIICIKIYMRLPGRPEQYCSLLRSLAMSRIELCNGSTRARNNENETGVRISEYNYHKRWTYVNKCR